MKNRATAIGFFGFGLLLAVGLWMATVVQNPILQVGFQRSLSEWTISHPWAIKERISGHSWNVFLIGPVVITVRTNDR
jgi:hypothetical protein